MSSDFFTQLESDLGSLTHAGMHLDQSTAQRRRRFTVLIRRVAITVGLAIALGVSLSSEFPATASGHAPTMHTWAVQGW